MSKDERYVALYARLSKEEGYSGRKGNSISHQFEIMRDYAELHDLGRVLEYEDNGFSGTNFSRPDFLTMMRDIQRGLIGTVIVKDLSRFGREYLESGEYIERIFPKFNVRFIAVMDGVDSNIPSTMERIAYLNADNERYAREVSNKQRIVIENKGNRGRRLTTRAIYGYRKNPDNPSEWLIDEEVSENVRKIFELYAADTPVTKIAEYLFEHKAVKPSVYEKPSTADKEKEFSLYLWSVQTITSILSKREYCGDTVNFRTTRKSFKDKEIIHNDEDKIKIFPDTHPAIISRELFERVQERLSKRKRMKRIEDVPLFMCMIVCADCNSRMHLMRTRNKNRGHYDAYVCSRYRNADKSRKFCTSHYIREEVLRTEVLQQIRSVHYDFLHDRESFRQMVLERLQESETISRESLDCQIEDMNVRLANQKDFLRHTFENFIRELVPKEALADMSRHYADQTEELELRLEKLRRKRAEESEVLKNLERFFNALAGYEEITELTPEILCDLVDKIEVHEGIKIKGSREKISQVDIYYVGAGKLKD